MKVEKRTLAGKKVKKLRRDGIIPANIYGKDFKSVAVQLPIKAFVEVFKKAHETSLVNVELEGKITPVLIHNVQIHPASQEYLHADFYKVNLKEKIKANIPVIAVEESPAVQNKLGLLLQTLPELEVEALPEALPENIEVSIKNLTEVNQEIKVSDIKAVEDVAILTDPNQIIFKIGELVTKETEEETKVEEAAAQEAKAESVAEEAKTENQQTAKPQEETKKG